LRTAIFAFAFEMRSRITSAAEGVLTVLILAACGTGSGDGLCVCAFMIAVKPNMAPNIPSETEVPIFVTFTGISSPLNLELNFRKGQANYSVEGSLITTQWLPFKTSSEQAVWCPFVI
jgi:hypothetical protein